MRYSIPVILNIFLFALSVSRNILSNDNISTRLGVTLYSSYIVLSIKPILFCIRSPGAKLKSHSCVEISITDPSAEKIGFIVSG